MDQNTINLKSINDMTKIPTLMLALGLLSSADLRAFNPQPDPPGFGMVGITAGQTLRFNVSNAQLPPIRGFPPGPCRVELTIFDGAGNLLLPAVRTTLAPGVSTHLDLRGDDVTNSDHPRQEVRPVFRFLDDSAAGNDSAFPPGPCVSSIEIIDNLTGKPVLTAGPQNAGLTHGSNPEPGPLGELIGLLSIGAGQTARLNAVHVTTPADSGFPPGPCRVSLVIFDDSGNVLAHSLTVLNLGQATFLDVSLPDPGIGASGDASVRTARVELRGVMAVESLDGRAFPPGPCRMTLEVFDHATAKTTAFLSP